MSGRPGPTIVSTGRRAAAIGRLLATVSTLVGGLVVLWQAGDVLPSLPLDRAGAARASAEADPVALAIAALRLAALAVGAGLLVLTALGTAARCCGAARLAIRLDRWTPPGLRRLLDGALGVGLAASIGLTAAPAGAVVRDPPPGASSTIKRLPDPPATRLRRLPDAPLRQGWTPPGPSLRRLPDATPALTAPTAPPTLPAASPAAPADAAAAAPSPPARAAPAPAPDRPSSTATAVPAEPASPSAGRIEVVVQAGGSFWRLAEEHVADRLGRQPTEEEIGACWQELVAVNRSRLVVPDDPDLLFPGQRLLLPCR
jgi:hypothetical protein